MVHTLIAVKWTRRWALVAAAVYVLQGGASQAQQSPTPSIAQIAAGGTQFAPSARELARQASEALKDKDYDQAITLLRWAIAVNPDDEGAGYNPWKFDAGQSAPLMHGQLQVARMLADRPQMAKYVQPTDPLLRSAVLKYMTKFNGMETVWDSTSTSSPSCGAEHSTPVRNVSWGAIRIDRRDDELCEAAAFEKLWAGAMFELHNIENARAFRRLYRQATDGEVTHDEFVKGMVLIEFRAAQRTRRWYVEVFLPHAKQYELSTDPVEWYCGQWGSAEEQFPRYVDRQAYPWMPYSDYYRQLRAQPPAHETWWRGMLSTK
jgi:hypothetical protein